MTAVETYLQPNDIMQIMFTSGTTGKPKGVLHTSNTLLSSISEIQKRLQLTSDDVLFMPSPFAHSIGFHYGIMLSIYLGAPLVTMDIWDPEKAVDLIERHGITYIFASTPFLSDLVNVADLKRHNIDSLRIFMTAGAPVPPTLVEEAGRVLNANIITGWGMTETGLVTSTLPALHKEGIGTDGIAMPCSEVRVIDDDGKELPRGEAGNLQCRGSTTFVGYYRRPDLYEIDEHGWFDTGDLAKMNGDDYISIVGRSKDIIIRGGENIPVVEVEKLIFEMPQVREVALTGITDPRLGEKSCAFVSLYPGKILSLADISNFLHNKNLAKQYMPERLEIIEKMPKTPSGKIQKFVLREYADSLLV